MVIEPESIISACSGASGCSFWWRNITHQTFQHIGNAPPVLAEQRTASVASIPTISSSSFRHALRVSGWQVDLVQNRHHLEIHFHRRGSLPWSGHALPRIHHQQRAFTGASERETS